MNSRSTNTENIIANIENRVANMDIRLSKIETMFVEIHTVDHGDKDRGDTDKCQVDIADNYCRLPSRLSGCRVLK
jgi:hypothetical protein